MSEWFVARAGQQDGPMDLAAVHARIDGGRLSADDTVWRQGMAVWTRAADTPELAASFGQSLGVVGYSQPFTDAGPPTLTDRSLLLLRQTAPWVRFFGILFWIAAGLVLLTSLVSLFGIIGTFSRGNDVGAVLVMGVVFLVYTGLGLLYVVPGVYLNRYASSIRRLIRSRREDDLETALQAQKSFWKFVGILTIVSFGFGLMMAVGVPLLAVLAVSRATTPTATPVMTQPYPTTPATVPSFP